MLKNYQHVTFFEAASGWCSPIKVVRIEAKALDDPASSEEDNSNKDALPLRELGPDIIQSQAVGRKSRFELVGGSSAEAVPSVCFHSWTIFVKDGLHPDALRIVVGVPLLGIVLVRSHHLVVFLSLQTEIVLWLCRLSVACELDGLVGKPCSGRTA